MNRKFTLMASDPNIPINPPGGPYFTQRLWSEEVAIALAESGDPISVNEPGYEFSNGRSFNTPPPSWVGQLISRVMAENNYSLLLESGDYILLETANG